MWGTLTVPGNVKMDISAELLRITSKSPVVPMEMSGKKAINPHQEFQLQLEAEVSSGFNGIFSVIFSGDHWTLGCHPQHLCGNVWAFPNTKR